MVTTTGGDVWEDVCPLEDRQLSDAHRYILEVESGIDADIIERRGYHSLSQAQVIELVNLEVLHPQALHATDWLAIPLWRPDGDKHGEVIRLSGGTAKLKYLWPTGKRLAFDIHPDNLEHTLNTDIEVLITEGVKKGDALLSAARREGRKVVVISLAGCEGWRMKVAGKRTASQDYLDIAWEDRRTYVISDSDYKTNESVQKGWSSCVTYTASKTGPHRTMLVVVPPDGTEKQGADDYLAAGNTLASLLGYAQSSKYAELEDSEDRTPLKTKSGLQLMREAGTKIPHLIEPVVPEGSIVLIAGHSGTYKTWALLSLSLDSAFGFPWMDHPAFTTPAPFKTLYVNKEMSSVFLGHRLQMLAMNKRYTSVPDWEKIIEDRIISIDEPSLDLNLPDHRARLEDAIAAHGAQLVVLDSLSMSWHGEENSSTEVGAFYSALREISARTGVAWAIIHHLLKAVSPSIRQKDPLLAAIRGSGQLGQQADSAVMLSHYQSDGHVDGEHLIAMSHAKARTGGELPSWVTTFSANDGLFASLMHLCSVVDAKATSYSKSGGSNDKLGEWLYEQFKTMPGMQPTASGIRLKSLVALLQSSWTVPNENPPSESTIRRRLTEMVEAGRIDVEASKKNGDLFRLKDIDDEPEPPAPPLTTGTSPVVRSREKRKRQQPTH